MHYKVAVNRIAQVGQLINHSGACSVLDVGSRSGALAGYLQPHIKYSGCDLTPGDDVHYVGDISELEIGERFDCVAALDILEHLENPFAVFDKLYRLAKMMLVVSLPNCFDIRAKVNFLCRDRVGGKYDFGLQHRQDRHRWIMSCDEIRRFYRCKAEAHGASLRMTDVSLFDEVRGWTVAKAFKALPLLAVPPSWRTSQIIGVFSISHASRSINFPHGETHISP